MNQLKAIEYAKKVVEKIHCPDYHWQRETDSWYEFKEFLIKLFESLEEGKI